MYQWEKIQSRQQNANSLCTKMNRAVFFSYKNFIIAKYGMVKKEAKRNSLKANKYVLACWCGKVRSVYDYKYSHNEFHTQHGASHSL